jgi:radical SAM protein with 4Fe4S-binding SPASM domain
MVLAMFGTPGAVVRALLDSGRRSLHRALRRAPARSAILALPGADRAEAGEHGISHARRLEIERWSRERREAALLEGRFEFEAGPYEAHVCFNNYCNMSCVMCWNGANPPVVKMAPALVARFEAQVAPWLSVITPYDGSEPLIAGWETTRRVAETHGIELCLTTNVQFLSEARFRELESITETLALSIDSHLHDVFERIRPGSKPDVVFANLPRAAELANACGLECIANVVLLTLNAPHVHETVAFLADAGMPAVHVLQMMDVNPQSGQWNPLVHLAADELARVKSRCIETAREKRIRLVWDVAGVEDHDFRRTKIGPTARKADYDHWDWRMRRLLPGYCRFVRDRLRISVEGSVAPCSYSTDGELELGNLARDDFSDMWNGAKLRDLRRAHLTWDLPTICASCRLSDRLPPEAEMPFTAEFQRTAGVPAASLPRALAVTHPPHMTRHKAPPRIRIARPDVGDARYTLVLALGGEAKDLVSIPIEPSVDETGDLSFEIPRKLWRSLRPNLGYWWEVVAGDPTTGQPIARSSEIRCLVRHRPIRRIPGSELRYPDEGHLPVVDLGGVKTNGDGILQLKRPALGKRRFRSPWDEPR